MSSKNDLPPGKNNSADSLGKFKNADVDKKTSSLILNYSSETPAGKTEKSENTTNSVTGAAKTADSTPQKDKVKKKSKTTNLSKTALVAEKNKEELKEQVESLKQIKKFLNMEVSTLISLGIAVVKKVNKKLFGSNEGILETKEKTEEPPVENIEPEVTGPFSFKTLIDMNIIFTDNKKKPLYFAAKKDSMYTQNDEILTVATMNRMVDVLHDTATKLKKVPVPELGNYKDIPLTEVFRNITDDEIYRFLFYVKKFPSKYIGKNYRFSESFAAWVISGTPDN